MLWLASLLGAVGVGAASLAVIQTPTDADEPDPAEDDLGHDEALAAYGNLMEQLPEPEETVQQPLVLDEEMEVAWLAPPESFSKDLLQGIVEEPHTAEMVAPDNVAWLEDDPQITRDDVGDPAPIMLGDWIMEGPPSEVLDYEAGKDSLMLVWDDLAEDAQEPEVRVEEDPYDPEVMHVLMNNKSVAEVYGDPELSVGDVTLIPLSSALIVGLEPA